MRFSIRSIFIVVFVLGLSFFNLQSQTMPMDDNNELSFDIPEDWLYHRKGEEIHIRAKGANLQITRIMFKDAYPESQEQVDAFLKNTTEEFLSGSVQDEAVVVHIKGLMGSYINYTDKTLVGKWPKQGQYKEMSIGYVCFGRFMMKFTLLTNRLDSEVFKKGLGIIESFKYHKKQVGKRTIPIPGETWTLSFKYDGDFDEEQIDFTTKGYMIQGAQKNGLNVITYVEKKTGKKSGHEACADNYWAHVKTDPKIDLSSVKKVVRENLIQYTYRIKDGNTDRKNWILGANLYFEYKDKWVDVHLWKSPYEKADEALFDTFIESLTCNEQVKEKDKTGKDAAKKDGQNTSGDTKKPSSGMRVVK